MNRASGGIATPDGDMAHGGLSFSALLQRLWGGEIVALTMSFLVTPGIPTCGDMIFSGHTLLIILFCLTFHTYYPKTKHMYSVNGVKAMVWILGLVGVFFIIATRLHYTLDVLLAVFLAMTLWNSYHRLANTIVTGAQEVSCVWVVDALIIHPLVHFLESGPDMLMTTHSDYKPSHSWAPTSSTKKDQKRAEAISANVSILRQSGIESLSYSE